MFMFTLYYVGTLETLLHSQQHWLRRNKYGDLLLRVNLGGALAVLDDRLASAGQATPDGALAANQTTSSTRNRLNAQIKMAPEGAISGLTLSNYRSLHLLLAWMGCISYSSFQQNASGRHC